jgi:hypothetical protein
VRGASPEASRATQCALRSGALTTPRFSLGPRRNLFVPCVPLLVDFRFFVR